MKHNTGGEARRRRNVSNLKTTTGVAKQSVASRFPSMACRRSLDEQPTRKAAKSPDVTGHNCRSRSWSIYAKCSTGLDRELSRNSRTKPGVITVAGLRKTTQYGSAWIPGSAGSAITCVTFQIRKRSESHSGSQCCSGSSPSRSSRTSPFPQDPHKKVAAMGRQ